jgi:hypothetical protein
VPAAAGGAQPGLLQDLVDPPRVEPGRGGQDAEKDRPGVDLEVGLVDDEHVAEALGEALDVDGRHGVPPCDG